MFAKSPLNRLVFRLAGPALLSMVGHTAVSVSDTAMVGSLGSEAIAAAGVGGLLVWTCLSLMFGISMGIQIIVARRHGEQELVIIGNILRTTLFLVVIFGTLLALGGYAVTPTLLRLFELEPKVLTLATSFVQIRFLGLIFFILPLALTGFYNGLGRTDISMYSAIVTSVSNIFGNWLLIYGHLGFPAYGINGAALASGIAGLLGSLLLIAFMFSKDINVYGRSGNQLFSWRLLGEITRISLPPGLEEFLMHISFLAFYKLAALIGTISLAATNIIVTMLSISAMLGFSFGIAATTLVSQAIGSKHYKQAQASAYRCAHFAAMLMGFFGLVFIFFGKQIIQIFTGDSSVIDDTYPALIIIGIFQVGDAYHMVFASALKGSGFVYWVMTVYILASYLIMLPTAYLVGIVLGFGTSGLWVGVMLWIITLSFSFIWKFRQGKFRQV